MSYDRAARQNQMDRATDSMASHGWNNPTTVEVPAAFMAPVRTSDMVRILDDVAQTRHQPIGAMHTASELAYGSTVPGLGPGERR